MKATQLKLKVFGLLAMLTLSLVSCSDDGKSADFWEKNGGTTWKYAESGGTIYARINSSESNPIEVWASLFDACYIYETFASAGDVEVLENKEHKVVIRIDESDTEYTILEMRISGDVLTIASEIYEDGALSEDEVFILVRTTDDVDNLELCDI
jgi:hypothetical protein